MRSIRRLALSALMCGLLVVSSLTARASTVLEVSLDRLTERCVLAVRGEVLDTSGLLEPGGALVWTRHRVRVAERLVGTCDDEVTVLVPGGEVGDLRQEVKGVARLRTGEDVVLFLWQDAAGRYRVLGQAQGAYHVERNTETGALECASRLDGLVLLRVDGRAQSGDGERRRHRLDDLRRRVRTVRADFEARREAARRIEELRRAAAIERAVRLRELTKGKPGSAE